MIEVIDKKYAMKEIADIERRLARTDAQKKLVGRILFMLDTQATIEAEPVRHENGCEYCKWIPVEDALPEDNEIVWVCLYWELEAFVRKGYIKNEVWYTTDGYRMLITPKFWMHKYIPEPPKEDEIKLKPCPFCGCTNIIYTDKSMEKSNNHSVFCPNCGCGTGFFYGSSPDYILKQYAINAWNRRSDNAEKVL